MGLKFTRPPELVRDFIQDCLYSPTHGYFSRMVNIFGLGEPIQYNKLKGQDEYGRRLVELYRKQSGAGYHQLWHTPSELFKPWYGKAIAEYMVREHGGHNPLVMYEIGPGNGTLAKSIMDHLQANHPSIYAKSSYNLIEISPLLVNVQRATLKEHPVNFYEGSALDMEIVDDRECFVLGMEVLDNLPHDRISYDDETGDLLQGTVWTNDDAIGIDEPIYRETFEPATDPLIIEYMNLMDKLGRSSPSLKWHPARRLNRFLGINDPWSSEFIPTACFKLLQKIKEHLPRHRLIISDFSSLPDTIKGYGAPVVQTRYEGDTIACSTYLLKRGLFDIFFPTDFQLLRQVHQSLTGQVSKIVSHQEFCSSYAEYGQTRTRSGYNPMLEEFQNVHFYLS